MIIVSACLAGLNCRYNGQSSLYKEVEELVRKGSAIVVCPEQLGGCPTPRPAAEISGGSGADVFDGKARVIRNDGKDVTQEFIKGAEEVLKIARITGAKIAILKSKSPSCGCGLIYDGSFSGKLIDGNGVAAELLMRNGVKVITEKDIKNQKCEEDF